MLVCSFLVVSLSGFGVGVMLASLNELGTVPSSLILGKVGEGLVLVL